MSEKTSNDLTQKTRSLLQGPLKNAKNAALTALLVPLATVAVSAINPGAAYASGGNQVPEPASIELVATAVAGLGALGVARQLRKK